MRKRGQVTLFIILGIVLVLAVSLVIVFRDRLTVFNPSRLFEPERTPFQRFVDDCVKFVSIDAINLLGAQGGYIFLPPDIENNPLARIDLGGVKVPLWQYRQEGRIPTIRRMESDINRYVTENLPSCLNNFDAFREQFDFKVLDDIFTDATIGSRSVDVVVSYPIELLSKDGKKVSDFKTFSYESPVLLQQIYDLGTAVFRAEIDEKKLEDLSIDLLSLDPDIPTVGQEFSCSRKTWSRSGIQNKFITLLTHNLPKLRVEKTSYPEVPVNQPYLLNHYVWDPLKITYPDLAVSFSFDNHIPMVFNARPGGETIKSNEVRGSKIASFVCVQNWNVVYDTQFPVVVTVEDLVNNYVFNFGFNVQISGNRPSREEFIQQEQRVAESPSEKVFCDSFPRGLIMRVNTFENISSPVGPGEVFPLHGVNLSFTCLKYSCDLGRSEYDVSLDQSFLEADFPYCPNGILRATKKGFKPFESFVSTVDGADVGVYLTPLFVPEKYSVVKHLKSDKGLLGARALDSDERAFISLKYKKGGRVVHESFGGFPVEFKQKPIELLGGSNFPYVLEIFVTDDEGNLKGGYSSTWSPDWFDLRDSKEIVFHTVVGDVEGDKVLTFLSQLPELSKQVPEPVLR